MSIFVQLASFQSISGKFDEKKDSQRINEILSKLREKGAKIEGISASIGGSGGANATAIYLITYEANASIEI